MKRALLLSVLFFCAVTAFADEGMWMVHAIDRALEKKMKATGLQLDARMIYDEEKESLSDAGRSARYYRDVFAHDKMASDDGLLC